MRKRLKQSQGHRSYAEYHGRNALYETGVGAGAGERAKAFYVQAGFKLEVDTRPNDAMRVIQFTPPGSACSIVFGTGMREISGRLLQEFPPEFRRHGQSFYESSD